MSRDVFWSAFIGSDNLGDEAIFISLLHNLQIDQKQLSVVTVNSSKTQKKAPGVQTVDARSPLAMLREIRHSRVVLLGGGGIIQDQSSLLNFLYFAYQMFVARIYKKPVILCFVGVGPLNRALSRVLFKWLASTIYLAVVRDEKSRRELLAFVPTEKIFVAHDPVLNLPFESQANPRKNSNTVIVSLRRWFFTIPLLPARLARRLNAMGFARRRYDRFVAAVAASLDGFLDNHPEAVVQFTSLYDSEDLPVTADVLERMRYHERCVQATPNLTEEAYLKLVQDARFVIGMRFHSLVLSSVVNTPFVSISYSTKVTEFANDVGLGGYLLDVEHFSEPEAIATYGMMYGMATQLHTSTQGVVNQFKNENDMALKRLRGCVVGILGGRE